MMKIFAFVLVALTAIPAVATAGCGGPGNEITGILRIFQGQHPNGTQVEVMQIATEKPFLALSVNGDACISASAIHIIPADPETETALRAMAGQPVTVVSDDVFEAHTAWHFGDAVAMGATFPTAG
jgi:hypothetical protein